MRKERKSAVSVLLSPLRRVFRKLWASFATMLIERAKKTPYLHIYGEDGSPYMYRYWLFRSRWLSARIHHIASHDRDPYMHDHPWSFVSVVLRGCYMEQRPLDPTHPVFNEAGVEPCGGTARGPGSICYRRACDRHRISFVGSGTYTLFILGPLVQWWGFYTPAAKLYYRDYLKARSEAQQKAEPR